MPRVQPARAGATRLGHKVHHRVHVLDRHQLTMVPLMPRLSTGLATTLDATTTSPLLAGKAIGGWGLRRDGGVLLTERKLPFEIGDLFRLLRELLAQPVVLAAQALDLLRLSITEITKSFDPSRSLRVLRLHLPERTKLRRKVQVQNTCQT